MIQNKGKIFIISAPSGVGKSSLIRELLKKQKHFKISISHTTRLARPGEKNGKHYYFISINKFKNMIKKKSFLEYAKVFNNYYGTSKKNVEIMLSMGVNIFLNIDWQGARQIKKIMPDKTISIFILPPSKKELQRRLIYRKQDSNYIICERMKQSVLEITHYHEYDYLVINDNFYIALENLTTIICAEKFRLHYQKEKYKKLIKKLIT